MRKCPALGVFILPYLPDAYHAVERPDAEEQREHYGYRDEKSPVAKDPVESLGRCHLQEIDHVGGGDGLCDGRLDWIGVGIRRVARHHEYRRRYPAEHDVEQRIKRPPYTVRYGRISLHPVRGRSRSRREPCDYTLVNLFDLVSLQNEPQ